MRATDPGERALVAEERVELTPLAPQDLPERGCVELERVGAEVRELGLERVGRQEPDARALLLPGLGEHELAAVRERDPEHRLRRPLLAGREVPEPARAHQVHAEDELAVVGGKEEVLAAPARARERPPLERARGRLEALQRRDVTRSRRLDGRAGDQRVELPHPGLDLGSSGMRSA